MSYKVLKNFAFGGKTYLKGDTFNSKGVIKLLVGDLLEKGLIGEDVPQEGDDA